MYQIITGAASYLFPGGRTLKLFKNGINITKSTNPLIITKNVTLTVVDCCAPPPIRLAFHCTAAVATIEAPMVAPNPVTIGSAVHLVTEIYESC